jgi:hypothetical protein
MKHRHLFRRLLQGVRDNRGSVTVYFALILPVLLGGAGLATDVISWHLNKRVMQSAVDSAALAGALEMIRTGTSNVSAAAEGEARANGLRDEDVLTVNAPPVSGARAGSGDAVEVIMERTVPTALAHLVFDDQVKARVRATAISDLNDTCVWALDPSIPSAFKVSGSANVAINCGIFVNSDDESAITQSGTSCLTATRIKSSGGSSGTCLNPDPVENVPQIVDPLSYLEGPSYGSCDFNAKVKVNSGDTRTLDPGVYCGGIEVQSGGTLHFNEGIYVLGGGLTFASSSVVTGSNVMFYLPPSAGQGDNINIAAGADVTLSAIEDGEYAGILFFHDRNSPNNISHSITGGSTMNLEGILYFPNQNLKFSGGSAVDASASMLIARTVDFVGITNIGGFEGTVVEKNPALVKAVLIE